MTALIPTSGPHRRAAFSLAELLVAMTIALMVMATLATLFGAFGTSLSQSQAIIDLSARMRTAAWQLKRDLAGVTVEVEPWAHPEANAGYFELIEGPQTDLTFAFTSVSSSGTPTANLEGDIDDVLLFTTRSAGEPFVGRYDAETIESPVAEVAWLCKLSSYQPVANLRMFTLYRRQLLVDAYVGREPFLSGTNAITAASGTSGGVPLYDLSFRTVGTKLVPNSLGDLTKRENRFLHNTAGFPFAFLGTGATGATFEGTSREGEDLVLTNVIAFDVRVFDPAARAQPASPTTLYPGDRAYAPASAAGAAGAYVDLGGSGAAPEARQLAPSVPPFPPVGATALQSGGLMVSSLHTLSPRTYDTWSWHYEFNGVNEDGDTLTDEGTNGLDDNENGEGQPDDSAERETSPPYPVPLRGIEVRLRCYEPSSKQVRQVTIRHTFLAR